MGVKEEIARRRSRVRVVVTYLAAAWVFGASALLIFALWVDALDDRKLSVAKEVFTMVLPVATGIITYWFASRKPERDLADPGRYDRPEADD